MKQIVVRLLVVLLIFAFAGCVQTPAETPATQTTQESASQTPDPSAAPVESDRIGVALRSMELTRRSCDLGEIKQPLEVMGYRVDLLYCDNDLSIQLEQIKNLVICGCKVIIIEAVDGGVMDAVLAQAKEAGITVIAYNHPIVNTPNADYYVRFDYFDFGVAQGEYIEEALNLKSGKGRFFMEIFAGPPNGADAISHYNGAMSVLEPYINNGQLVVKSGGVSLEETATDYSAEKAKERMQTLLATHYKKHNVDVILSYCDLHCRGIVAALKDAGYGSEKKPYPLLTGVDSVGGHKGQKHREKRPPFTKENIIMMMEGSQSMTVYMDTRIMEAKAVEMADLAITGGNILVNGIYHNNVKDVPAFSCKPSVATTANIEEILLDNGYMTEYDLDSLAESAGIKRVSKTHPQ